MVIDSKYMSALYTKILFFYTMCLHAVAIRDYNFTRFYINYFKNYNYVMFLL